MKSILGLFGGSAFRTFLNQLFAAFGANFLSDLLKDDATRIIEGLGKKLDDIKRSMSLISKGVDPEELSLKEGVANKEKGISDLTDRVSGAQKAYGEKSADAFDQSRILAQYSGQPDGKAYQDQYVVAEQASAEMLRAKVQLESLEKELGEAKSKLNQNIQDLEKYKKDVRDNQTGQQLSLTPDTPVSELISPDQFTPIFEQLGTAFTASITEALTPLKDAIAQTTPCLCKEGGAEGGSSLALPAPVRVAEEVGLSAPVTSAKGVITPDASISGSVKDGTDGAKASLTAFGEDAKSTFLALAEQGNLSADSIKGAFKKLAGSLLRDQILPKLLGANNPLSGIVSGGLGKILGFASGGKPPVGVPSLVGERGPELFVPDISGRIVNANATRGMMGGGGMTLSPTIHMSPDIKNTVREEILNALPTAATTAAQMAMAQMNGVRR